MLDPCSGVLPCCRCSCLQLTLQLLAGKAAPPSTAGLLADTLHLLAAGLEEAPQRTRKDLSLKLLLLFSEVAAGVGVTGVVRADLGDLLVAVAVAAEGLERTMRLLGGSSSSISRMSMHDIQVGGGAAVCWGGGWPVLQSVLAFCRECLQSCGASTALRSQPM